MGNLREHEVHSAALMGLGFVPGEVHYAASGSATPYGFLRDSRKLMASRLHPTILEAYKSAGVQNGNNNVVVVSPDSHTQSAALTLNKNMTHLVGAYPLSRMGQRARIGHDADVDALITITGYGNLLKSLYVMHGRGSATNLHAMEITGDRNTLENVHLAGPLHATEAAEAGYSVLELTGALECYFKGCTFGADTVARGVASAVLRMGSDSSRNVFEDCVFLSMCSATTPYFIEVLSTNDWGWTLFKNCTFINYSSSWATKLAVGILNSSPSYVHKLFFDSRCTMFGVTDIIAAAGEASVEIGTVPWASADKLNNMLYVNPDLD